MMAILVNVVVKSIMELLIIIIIFFP